MFNKVAATSGVYNVYNIYIFRYIYSYSLYMYMYISDMYLYIYINTFIYMMIDD